MPRSTQLRAQVQRRHSCMIRDLLWRRSVRRPATLACAIFSAHTALAQTTVSRCPLPNPILAVVPEVFVPGLGHLYIGGGETKRGKVLLSSMAAGMMLIVGSAATGAGSADHTAHDFAIDVGADAMIASWLLSIGDIIPAMVRERRRCERGDERSRFNARAVVLPAPTGRRLRAGLSIRLAVP